MYVNTLKIKVLPHSKVFYSFFFKNVDLDTIIFLKDFIYLFLERVERGGGKRERSINSCLLHTPNWGPGLQPRHVPRLEIEPATLWSAGQHSSH